MSEERPNYSLRIAHHRQWSYVAGFVCALATCCGVMPAVKAIFVTSLGETAEFMVFSAGLLCGSVAGFSAGYATKWLLRSFWPEHPDEE